MNHLRLQSLIVLFRSVDTYPSHASAEDVSSRQRIIDQLRQVKRILLVLGSLFNLNPEEIAAILPPEGQGGGSQAERHASQSTGCFAWPGKSNGHKYSGSDPTASNSMTGGVLGDPLANAALIGQGNDFSGQPQQQAPRNDFMSVPTGSFEQDVAQISSQPWFQLMENLNWNFGVSNAGATGADNVAPAVAAEAMSIGGATGDELAAASSLDPSFSVAGMNSGSGGPQMQSGSAGSNFTTPGRWT